MPGEYPVSAERGSPGNNPFATNESKRNRWPGEASTQYFFFYIIDMNIILLADGKPVNFGVMT